MTMPFSFNKDVIEVDPQDSSAAAKERVSHVGQILPQAVSIAVGKVLAREADRNLLCSACPVAAYGLPTCNNEGYIANGSVPSINTTYLPYILGENLPENTPVETVDSEDQQRAMLANLALCAYSSPEQQAMVRAVKKHNIEKIVDYLQKSRPDIYS